MEEALSRPTQWPPSQRLIAEEVLGRIGADLQAIGQVAETCTRRIFAEEKVSSREKIVSLSDGDAAFIVKGG